MGSSGPLEFASLTSAPIGPTAPLARRRSGAAFDLTDS